MEDTQLSIKSAPHSREESSRCSIPCSLGFASEYGMHLDDACGDLVELGALHGARAVDRGAVPAEPSGPSARPLLGRRLGRASVACKE